MSTRPGNRTDPWIAFRKPQQSPRLRLFCLPYAGGGASIYRTWQTSLPGTVEVMPVQFPGRENRLVEPAFTAMEPLVEALCQAMTPWLEVPFAFFGYSYGALVAYEAALRLQAEKGIETSHLIVAAHRAPQVPNEDRQLYNLDDDEFRVELEKLEGTPKEVLEHPELMELMMPLLRADFEINDTYRIASVEATLGCPVTALGGLGDHDVAREHLEPWKELTRGRFRLRMLPGGHFFIHEQRMAVLDAVAESLRPLASPRDLG